jgi:DNA phosphorothioation-dependent restriction protein DptH
MFATGQSGWQGFWNAPFGRCNIVQFQSLSKEYARVGTEFCLWDLFYFAQSRTQFAPLPIVLDEVQNLNHELESPIGKMLTEGRKFGVGLMLATQTLSALKNDELDRLFQAAHKLYFSPAQTELKEYARLLERSDPSRSVDDWVRELSSLSKGECISVGPSLEGTKLRIKPLRIKITRLEERAR